MAVMSDAEKYTWSYAHLRGQIANPPLGWYVFGTSASWLDSEAVVLEFWGEDVDGFPIWERPVS